MSYYEFIRCIYRVLVFLLYMLYMLYMLFVAGTKTKKPPLRRFFMNAKT